MSGPISEERFISAVANAEWRWPSGARAAPRNLYRNFLGRKPLRLMEVAARRLWITYLH
jgi:hypothetical protein